MEYRIKSNSDKTELAGILHQIKTKMIEKGLVSAEELEQYKARTLELQTELEKVRKELLIHKQQEETAPRAFAHSPTAKAQTLVAVPKKEQAVQCVLERGTGSPDRSSRDVRASRAVKGILAVYDDYSAGYIEPLVLS